MGKGEYEKVEHRGCNLRAADGKTVQENCESREGPEGKSRQYSRLVLVNDRHRFQSKVDTTVRKVNGRKSMEHCLARMHALLLTKLQQNTDDDRDRGGRELLHCTVGGKRQVLWSHVPAKQQLSRHLLSADEGGKEVRTSHYPSFPVPSPPRTHSLNHSHRDFLLCSVLFAKGPFEIASGARANFAKPPTHPYKSNCGYKCRITRNIPSFLPSCRFKECSATPCCTEIYERGTC